MKDIREILAYNLVMLRKGKSMATIAEEAGLPYRTYQDIEGGTRWPRVENLEAIAKALGVEVNRLFSAPAAEPTPEEALEIVRKALADYGRLLAPSKAAVILDPRAEALLTAIGDSDILMRCALTSVNDVKAILDEEERDASSRKRRG